MSMRQARWWKSSHSAGACVEAAPAVVGVGPVGEITDFALVPAGTRPSAPVPASPVPATPVPTAPSVSAGSAGWRGPSNSAFPWQMNLPGFERAVRGGPLDAEAEPAKAELTQKDQWALEAFDKLTDNPDPTILTAGQKALRLVRGKGLKVEPYLDDVPLAQRDHGWKVVGVIAFTLLRPYLADIDGAEELVARLSNIDGAEEDPEEIAARLALGHPRVPSAPGGTPGQQPNTWITTRPLIARGGAGRSGSPPPEYSVASTSQPPIQPPRTSPPGHDSRERLRTRVARARNSAQSRLGVQRWENPWSPPPSAMMMSSRVLLEALFQQLFGATAPDQNADGWRQIGDWQTLLDRVAGLGMNGAALVVIEQGGTPVTAVAVVNTVDGPYVANPTADTVTHAGLARSIRRAFEAAGDDAQSGRQVRVFLVDPAGNAVRDEPNAAPPAAAPNPATRSEDAAPTQPTQALPDDPPQYEDSAPEPPPFENFTGRHRHWVADSILRSYPFLPKRGPFQPGNYWLKSAERQPWWDKDKLKRLSKLLKAEEEELTAFSLQIGRIPDEIPELANGWGMQPSFVYRVARKINVAPETLSVAQKYLSVQNNVHKVASYIAYRDAPISAILAWFESRARDVNKRLESNYSLQILIAIAHYAAINIGVNVDALVRFLEHDHDGIGLLAPTDAAHLTPENVGQVADAWRQHERSKAWDTASRLLQSEWNRIQSSPSPDSANARVIPATVVDQVADCLMETGEVFRFHSIVDMVIGQRRARDLTTSGWREWPQEERSEDERPHVERPPAIAHTPGRPGRLPGANRDARSDPARSGRPIGAPVHVDAFPRHDRLMHETQPGQTAARAAARAAARTARATVGKGKDRDGEAVYTVNTLSAARVATTSTAWYTVSDSGRIHLPNGSVLPGAWIPHGTDFLDPDTETVLHANSGWIGTIINLDSLIAARPDLDPSSRLPRYTTHADHTGLYLIPPTHNLPAVQIPVLVWKASTHSDGKACVEITTTSRR